MRNLTRREFARLSALGAGAMMIPWDVRKLWAQIPGGSLPPGDVDKFVLPLVKPPALKRSSKRIRRMKKNTDYYEIAVRQFDQRIVSADVPKTTVWSYGSVDSPGTVAEGGTFNYPAFTVEAKYKKPVAVKWINELVDNDGDYLPHLLPVDPTLHWANPPGGADGRDKRPTFPSTPDPYTGPVPMVTHVHGAHVSEESDGYAEAWWLPDAGNTPGNYATTGTFYDYFKTKYGMNWDPGTATFTYPNDQPATTLWYHDHTLGMTRLNVYAGPAGYWLVRGGDYDMDLGYYAPGSYPADPLGEYTEIPIVIQDRSFNVDGSLFYPDTREFFDGYTGPYIPDTPISPIWNPEFFGNMMVVNGFTWPFLGVEQRRYRFRFLNGCNSRFLLLKMTTSPRMNNTGFNGSDHSFCQIGGDQGFLQAPAMLNQLLMAPAERADVVVDFSGFPVGTEIYLVNDGPDAPFGGISTEDLSDWESTGLVMKFVVKASTSVDTTTPPMDLVLPAAPMPGPADNTRDVTLNEEAYDDGMGFEGPSAALLGTLDNGASTPLLWMDPITENPATGAVEQWAIHNFTEDAHPIHIHQTHFEVVNREDQVSGAVRGPEAWETGYKDTVIAYPGEITRVKALYDLPGFYVWHCHIVEHEDNEMMRPFHVGPIPPDAPAG